MLALAAMGPDAVVTETRIPLDEWLAPESGRVERPAPLSVDEIDVAAVVHAVGTPDDDPAGPDLTRNLLPLLFADGDVVHIRT